MSLTWGSDTYNIDELRRKLHPSLWVRLKQLWCDFVKRHIVDDYPYQDEM